MGQTNKTAFISYSWDSDAHQKWVVDLANKLRREGVNATVDVFQTQSATVNLNTMMISNMRDNDFIIVVLTEKYAAKADNLQGGVGFETTLSLPVLRKNPDKFIFVLRHQGNFEDAFPFHLDGYYAFDFSDDHLFDQRFEELLYRINDVPRYKMEPVGKPKQLQPRDFGKNDTESPDFSDIEIPNLRRITDRDIDRFMKESFKKLVRLFHSLFSKIQSTNPNFEFDQDEIDRYKTIFLLYVDGENVTGLKIWFGSNFGSNNINFSYGRNLSRSDNSMNEMLTHYVNDKNQLQLKMIMNMHGMQDGIPPEEIVKEIWKNHLAYSVK